MQQMKWRRILAALLTLALMIPPMALPAAASEQPVLGVGLVEQPELPIYDQPQEGSAVTAYAAAGDWVVITAAVEDWYQVEYNLQTGYLPQQTLALRTVENVELGFGVVSVDGVNLRQGPSTGFRVSMVAQSGERCCILGINQGWYKVLCGGHVAYIRSDYLDLTEIPYENQAASQSPQFFRGGKAIGEPLADLAAQLLQSAASGGDGAVEVSQSCLEQMQQAAPGRAILWKSILQNWNSVYRELEIWDRCLPQGLPEDDSLCIVVFGYALNSDGSPAGELVQRLEVALTAAQQYPNAYILCTGGGTAQNSDNTEAGVMASWLMNRGVDPARILQENRSLSTTANAQRSFALLKSYPQIQTAALISSDYHIRRCALLFSTVSLYLSACGGRKPVEVVAAASCPAQSGGGEGLRTQAREIARVTGIPYYIDIQ